jgi:phenylalanine-4-hydroxylase
MPNIDRELWRRLIARQEKYNDVLARQQAERRLDELEAALDRERQRRGLQPVTNDDGTIIRWVHTRQQTPGGR